MNNITFTITKKMTNNLEVDIKSIVTIDQQCHFYEKKEPNMDDIVTFTPTRIDDIGVYVYLKEYHKEGFLPLSEITRRRVKNINKCIKINKEGFGIVTRLENDYIDISKKRAYCQDIEIHLNKYKKYMVTYNIIKQIADKNNLNLESLLDATLWAINRYISINEPDFKDTYSAFEKIGKNNDSIINIFEFDKIKPYNINKSIPEHNIILKKLLILINKRFTPKIKIVKSIISIICFYTGIDGIKRSLKAGLRESTKDCKIQIKYVTSPLYRIFVETIDSNLGINIINRSINEIKKQVILENGLFQINHEPFIETK